MSPKPINLNEVQRQSLGNPCYCGQSGTHPVWIQQENIMSPHRLCDKHWDEEGCPGEGKLLLVTVPPELDGSQLTWASWKARLLEKSSAQVNQPNRLRRKVLMRLYAVFTKDPWASVDRQTLAEMEQTDVVTLDPVAKFLQAEGWITLREFYGGDYLAQITPQGIRLVENLAEFNRQFPIEGESGALDG